MRPLQFTLAVFVFLSFTSLMGQIVYTQIDPPQSVPSGEGIRIDFNEDPFYTSFETKQSSGISFYPNPAGDFLKVDHMGSEGSIRILDLNGRVSFTQEYFSSPVTIPISSLANGVYILQVVNAEGRFIEKFVKD